MGIVIEIINTTTTAVPITNNPESAVIEVLTGLPGVQNVFVGNTPPPNPQIDTIWIDTSGG